MTHPWGDHKQARRAWSEVEAEMRRCNSCGRKCRSSAMEYGICRECLYGGKPRGAQAGQKRRPMSVVVLRDPSKTYRPNSAFNIVEFRQMLRDGLWPLGMVFRMGRGEIVVVCGQGKAYRRPAERLPRQWLRRLA